MGLVQFRTRHDSFYNFLDYQYEQCCKSFWWDGRACRWAFTICICRLSCYKCLPAGFSYFTTHNHNNWKPDNLPLLQCTSSTFSNGRCWIVSSWNAACNCCICITGSSTPSCHWTTIRSWNWILSSSSSFKKISWQTNLSNGSTSPSFWDERLEWGKNSNQILAIWTCVFNIWCLAILSPFLNRVLDMSRNFHKKWTMEVSWKLPAMKVAWKLCLGVLYCFWLHNSEPEAACTPPW